MGAGGVLIAGNLNVPLVWLVASVVAWMFTSASCVAVMEKLPWHDALYFVGSTLTTVGYGDVVVKSSAGACVLRGQNRMNLCLHAWFKGVQVDHICCTSSYGCVSTRLLWSCALLVLICAVMRVCLPCPPAGRLFVLVMMLVGVVLIPVRASQLYSRLSER